MVALIESLAAHMPEVEIVAREEQLLDGDGLSEYTKWPGTRAYVSDFERSFVNK